MRPVLACLIAFLALSGCASSGSAPTQAASGVMANCVSVDCKRIANIERAAQARGVTVVWVHPPQRKAETATP